ncbi:Amino acid adenylation domain protein [Pseudomonas cichorii]|uniref:Amino acid adenylation domain protein n=1 Tax=Pseudomonas cichorii TaxID=36746 RepID=A0A3M4LGN1_PSECI|nr:type I polyketide synthase [Pseudomonas cichorii]RMQ40639.1 Amino acid adenylation domain protein [Pseudomonas cichorii]
MSEVKYHGNEIAVISMSCRFPGADSIEQFWENLTSGEESIESVSLGALLEAGVPAERANREDYVAAAARLNNVDRFDADFFEMSAREAAITDPQHRLLLECAWEALDAAGLSKDREALNIGVFAGGGSNGYLHDNVMGDEDASETGFLDSSAGFMNLLGNDKDYLSTRIAYKLGLRGPSLNIQTACSTSLVSIHMACQSLLLGECDVALAGGVTVLVPHGVGYVHQEGMIQSPDGHCRAFDSSAQGTIFGSGAGLVTLKRLCDALEAGDPIQAVIKGSAINNDGSRKVSFAAPSSQGQAQVIEWALANAEVSAATVDFVEAHGTGTPLGDPIEFKALTDVFTQHGAGANKCALGSVKTNIGHLIAAAGVAGFIKAVLALKHRTIPATLHFTNANKNIHLDDSPFFISAQTLPWQSTDSPRRAGVSSFGVGGTNAHVILEEAPRTPIDSSGKADGPGLLALCAKDRKALTELINQYREMLERPSALSLRDMCYSARVGRAEFPYRYAASASQPENLLARLRQEEKDIHWVDPARESDLVFVFTGQGAQFPDMGKNLYEHNEVFRASIDRCDAIAQTCMGRSLLSILFPAEGDDARLIDQTRYAQPALFALEYSLAQVWQSFGVVPDILLGHSLGEFAAACVAGVFSLEDGMRLVAERGRLMQALPRDGGMSAITLTHDEVKTLLARHVIDLSIAAINAPNNLVVSGALSELDKLYPVLDGMGVKYTRLNVSHAFHSELMEPMLAAFASVLEGISMSAPRYPLVSNVSGEIATERLVTPEYWLDHVRQPVRFMACIQSAFRKGGRTFLEIGPKAVLSTIGAACLNSDDADQTSWITSLSSKVADREQILASAGLLFEAGIELDWHTLLEGATSTRVNTPGYPFQRAQHWVGPRVLAKPQWTTAVDWVEYPFKAPEAHNDQQLPGVWLFIGGTRELVKSIHQGLSDSDEHLVHAMFATDCRRVSSHVWHIRPDSSSDIHEVFQSLPASGKQPLRGVVHLGASGQSPAYDHPIDNNDSGNLNTGLYSVVAALQAMTATSRLDAARFWIVTRGAVNVRSASSAIQVSQATLWGLAKVIAQEEPAVWGGFIDLPQVSSNADADLLLVPQLILAKGQEDQFAIRHSGIHVPRLMEVSPAQSRSVSINPDATYLVVGGLGGLGREVLAWLVEKGARHLAVVGRTPLKATGSTVLDAFKHQGVDVDYLPVDISSGEAIESLTSYIDALKWPLRGVLQLAGTVEDAVLSKLSTSSIKSVLLPKLQGTRVLDHVTRGQTLDFFVAFSSISASLGFKGQANYVAANSAMDAIMENRVSSGLPGLSIAWGPWSAEGMASRVDTVFKKRLSTLGVNYIPAKAGLRKLWDNLHAQGVLGLAPIDWAPYKAHLQPGDWPYLSLVNTRHSADQTMVERDSVPFLEAVMSVDAEQMPAFIRDRLMSVAARVSGTLDASATPVDKSLTMMGFDSLMTVEFRNSLKVLGINFPLDRLIVGATLNDIGDFVLDHIETTRQGNSTDSTISSPPTTEDVQTSDCVVIPVPRAEATLRLFCFPYAGGGPAVFKGWADRLPDHIELCLLQLPGRNARLREKSYTSMEELVSNLTPDLLPYLDRPFAFFGLCLGGVQAFEVAQRLASAHNLHPSHLIFAGSRAPHFYNEHQFASDVQQFNYESDSEPAAKDDDEDLIAMLKEMNFANNQALFDDAEMRDLMLPIIKADYEINNTYLYETSPRLAVPITSIGGRIDPYATGVHITGWREHTTDAFKSVFCAGDHYFVEGQRDLIVNIVVETLADLAHSEITHSAETVYQ